MLMFVRVDCDRKRVGERILIRSMPEKSARLLPAAQVQPQKNSSGAQLAALRQQQTCSRRRVLCFFFASWYAVKEPWTPAPITIQS